METTQEKAITPRSDEDLLQEVERLGARLACRHSMTALAVGFISTMVAVISFGVSMRLLIESARLPKFFWPIAALFLVAFCLATVEFLKGRRQLREERALFRQYLELRGRAGLD